jgi:hypothetical protein
MISTIFHLTAMDHNFFATFLNLDTSSGNASLLWLDAWCKVNKNFSINTDYVSLRGFSLKIIRPKCDYVPCLSLCGISRLHVSHERLVMPLHYTKHRHELIDH